MCVLFDPWILILYKNQKVKIEREDKNYYKSFFRLKINV